MNLTSTALKAESSKLAGLVLVSASLLLTTGNLLHPRTSGGALGADSVALEAALIVTNLGVWYPAHVMLMLFTAAALAGFLILYRVLAARQETVFSPLALVCQGLAAVLLLISALMDGLLTPALAQSYLAATDAARPMATMIFEYNYLFSLYLLAPAFFLYALGYGLWGLALLRTQLVNNWIAWAGIALGLGGGVGYIAGLFGPYWVLSPNFSPFAIALALWLIVLGARLYRLQTGAEQQPEAVQASASRLPAGPAND